jgi:hypothetical protein
MAKGEATALSAAVTKGRKTGVSIGDAIRKNPKKSMAIGAGVAMGYGALRGRRGSGTGQRMPGSQRGIRNY